MSSGMSGQMTGKRPMNSGIMPNSSKSSDVTLPSKLAQIGMLLGLGLAAEADRLAAHAAGDDVFQADEGPAADEQDVGRVHLNILLLGMLAAPLRGHVGDGSLEHFQEGLLHPLARNVARDRDVVRGLADLVDFIDVNNSALGRLEIEIGRVQELEQDVLDVLADVAGLGERGRVADGERDVQDAGQGPRQQGLAAAGRADEQDVRLVQLDFGLGVLAMNQPLVVVVHGHRQNLLRPFLANHVGVELFLDFARGGNIREKRLGNAAPFAAPDREFAGIARCNRRKCKRRPGLPPVGPTSR